VSAFPIPPFGAQTVVCVRVPPLALPALQSTAAALRSRRGALRDWCVRRVDLGWCCGPSWIQVCESACAASAYTFAVQATHFQLVYTLRWDPSANQLVPTPDTDNPQIDWSLKPAIGGGCIADYPSYMAPVVDAVSEWLIDTHSSVRLQHPAAPRTSPTRVMTCIDTRCTACPARSTGERRDRQHPLSASGQRNR
jgi:hypothetical protein